MVIKSMSRKKVSFAQLYDYINSHDEVPYFVSWNLNLQNHMDRERVLNQFYQNARLLQYRKNGNALYHEIISFKYTPGVPLNRQMKALHDVTVKYLQARGNHLLSYGRMHMSQGHLHFHVMLSSNELYQSKRHRLSTHEFNQIRVQCERYLQQNYPELKQPTIYDREQTPNPTQAKNREYEFKKRTGKQTKKEQMREHLLELLLNVPNQDVEQWLRLHGFEPYKRGQTFGVTYNGKRYRFTTLGIQEEFLKARNQEPEPTPVYQQAPDSKEKTQQQKWEQELEDYYREVEQEMDDPDFEFNPN